MKPRLELWVMLETVQLGIKQSSWQALGTRLRTSLHSLRLNRNHL